MQAATVTPVVGWIKMLPERTLRELKLLSNHLEVLLKLFFMLIYQQISYDKQVLFGCKQMLLRYYMFKKL